MDRRSLLGFIAVAPFIVKASSLMPVQKFLDAGVESNPIVEHWSKMCTVIVRGYDVYGKRKIEKFPYGQLPWFDGRRIAEWREIEEVTFDPILAT